MRILIAGASSDIGLALLPLLCDEETILGTHCFEGGPRLETALCDLFCKESARLFARPLTGRSDCFGLVDEFVGWAGGIDCLVQLTGNVASQTHWENLEEKDWNADLSLNLSVPFFLAQCAFKYMKAQGMGRIVLMSTASASHGGGQETLAYGVAKAGVECLIKGLAKGGASHGVLVNGVAPGFIDTRFHRERLGRNEEAMRRRASLVPLGRAGAPSDVARAIAYLLSPGGDFITGETLVIGGGDWL